MELRLQQFIADVQSLSDIRNLDTFNPIIFQMQKPLTQTQFQVAGAKVAPSYLGFPINGTWVVLEPTSSYYLKALKLQLKSVGDSDYQTTLPEVSDLNAAWFEIQTYDEIFTDPQYYLNTGPVGPQGPEGPQGPVGPMGISPNISDIVAAVMQVFDSRVGTLEIVGADSISKGSNAAYSIMVAEPLVNNGAPREVFGPLLFVSGDEQGAANVSGTNVVSVDADLLSEDTIRLHASYVSYGTTISGFKDVQLKLATLVSLTLSGPSLVYSGDAITLSATGVYSDGSTGVVSPTYTLSNNSLGTISPSGVFQSASNVAQDTDVVVTATYTDSSGHTVSASKTVTVKQLLATGMVINGAASVSEGATSQYTATITYNNGRSATVTPVWTMNAGDTAASVSNTGLLTAAQVAAQTTVTLNASYTVPTAPSATIASKTVTVLNDDVIYPFFGTGPALPTDWNAFVNALPHRGTAGNVTADFSIDMIGATTYGYYAYPKSYGKAQFFDPNSNFVGGWGGAGNSKAGASAASIAAGLDTPLEATITVGGVAVPFYIYRTDYANLGAAAVNRWVVQPSA